MPDTAAVQARNGRAEFCGIFRVRARRARPTREPAAQSSVRGRRRSASVALQLDLLRVCENAGDVKGFPPFCQAALRRATPLGDEASLRPKPWKPKCERRWKAESRMANSKGI